MPSKKISTVSVELHRATFDALERHSHARNLTPDEMAEVAVRHSLYGGVLSEIAARVIRGEDEPV